MTYQEAIEKADHIKALGNKPVFLDDGGEYPWEYATSISGSSYRMGICTSVWITATCPISGLEVKWMVEIEPRSANGLPDYKIKAEYLEDVTNKIPPRLQGEWQDMLRIIVDKVHALASEYQAAADKQLAIYNALVRLTK